MHKLGKHLHGVYVTNELYILKLPDTSIVKFNLMSQAWITRREGHAGRAVPAQESSFEQMSVVIFIKTNVLRKITLVVYLSHGAVCDPHQAHWFLNLFQL